jgi:hypothetical protein
MARCITSVKYCVQYTDTRAPPRLPSYQLQSESYPKSMYEGYSTCRLCIFFFKNLCVAHSHALKGFDRAPRLCATRTHLFRLINSQNGRCAPPPRPSQLRCPSLNDTKRKSTKSPSLGKKSASNEAAFLKDTSTGLPLCYV